MLLEDVLIVKHMPETMKTAIAEYRTCDLVAPLLGTNDITFDKVAEYLGSRIAARHATWKTVGDGLEALVRLRQR